MVVWDDLGLPVVVMTVVSIFTVHSCGIKSLMEPWQEFPPARSLFVYCVPALPAEVRESSTTPNLESERASPVFNMHSWTELNWAVPYTCVWQEFEKHYNIGILCATSWMYNESEKNECDFCVCGGLFQIGLGSVSNPLCVTKGENIMVNIPWTHKGMRQLFLPLCGDQWEYNFTGRKKDKRNLWIASCNNNNNTQKTRSDSCHCLGNISMFHARQCFFTTKCSLLTSGATFHRPVHRCL